MTMVPHLKRIIRASVKTICKALSLKLLPPSLEKKYKAELAFQTGWAREFKDNKPRVLEYWRNYRYLDEIRVICKIEKNTRILDVGCGISTVLHYVDGKRYGIDPLADEYKRLYAYPHGIDIQKGFGEVIPFPDESFNVVFCSNVLDHVTDPQKTIDEIHRVLVPSGYFVLTLEIFEGIVQRDPAHPHSLTKTHAYSLLGSKFKIILEQQSPWIGLRNYVNGSRKNYHDELIMVLEKPESAVNCGNRSSRSS
jgi:ubiquinone/menaquinone biosynthesis C-methylase UbiE